METAPETGSAPIETSSYHRQKEIVKLRNILGVLFSARFLCTRRVESSFPFAAHFRCFIPGCSGVIAEQKTTISILHYIGLELKITYKGLNSTSVRSLDGLAITAWVRFVSLAKWNCYGGNYCAAEHVYSIICAVTELKFTRK